MVQVRFVNDTTPIEVTSEMQATRIAVKSSTGTDNHDLLSNRDLPDQHPISAITGLQEALDNIPDDYVTDSELTAKGYQTATQVDNAITAKGYITSAALVGYATESYVTTATANMQTTSNLVTSLSISSTDTQYPSAKCVYDLVGDVETLINAL